MCLFLYCLWSEDILHTIRELENYLITIIVWSVLKTNIILTGVTEMVRYGKFSSFYKSLLCEKSKKKVRLNLFLVWKLRCIAVFFLFWILNDRAISHNAILFPSAVLSKELSNTPRNISLVRTWCVLINSL